jgi:hypothetical protein
LIAASLIPSDFSSGLSGRRTQSRYRSSITLSAMLASSGESTPPCGVPVSVGLYETFSKTPALRNCAIRRFTLWSATPWRTRSISG